MCSVLSCQNVACRQAKTSLLQMLIDFLLITSLIIISKIIIKLAFNLEIVLLYADKWKTLIRIPSCKIRLVTFL